MASKNSDDDMEGCIGCFVVFAFLFLLFIFWFVWKISSNVEFIRQKMETSSKARQSDQSFLINSQTDANGPNKTLVRAALMDSDKHFLSSFREIARFFRSRSALRPSDVIAVTASERSPPWVNDSAWSYNVWAAAPIELRSVKTKLT